MELIHFCKAFKAYKEHVVYKKKNESRCLLVWLMWFILKSELLPLVSYRYPKTKA